LFRNALAIKPNIGPAWFGLGKYFLGRSERFSRDKSYEKAVNSFRNAVKAHPEYSNEFVYAPSEEGFARVSYVLLIAKSVEKMTVDQILPAG
jgi:hypothetical protein